MRAGIPRIGENCGQGGCGGARQQGYCLALALALAPRQAPAAAAPVTCRRACGASTSRLGGAGTGPPRSAVVVGTDFMGMGIGMCGSQLRESHFVLLRADVRWPAAWQVGIRAGKRLQIAICLARTRDPAILYQRT